MPNRPKSRHYRPEARRYGIEYAVLWVISLVFMWFCLNNLQQIMKETNFGATNI